jgi:hypothetical protein
MGTMTRDERQAARLALGKDAVMSEATAIELLPFSDAAARKWLRDRELVRDVPELGRCVIWADVLSALRGEADRQAERAPARPKLPPTKLPRKQLGRRRGEESE